MNSENRTAWAEIDLAAIAGNLRALHPDSPRRSVIAVVKADAYGHGAVEVSRTLAADGVEMLAVASLAEALQLRNSEIETPILLLGAYLPAQIEDILDANLTVSVSSLSFAEKLDQEARRRGVRANIHVKVDTGMGRLGIPEVRALETIEKMSVLPGLVLEGLYTHFPCADADGAEFTLRQVSDFSRITSALESMGVTFKYHHAASSGACLDIPESLFDTVRPGLALYGLRPSSCCAGPEGLKPAMEFASRVVHIERRAAGTTIGYGRTHCLEKDSDVAVLSAGYADGYDLRFSGKTVVTIRGRHAPVLGRVSMDLTSVDVTGIDGVEPGDKAVLFSTDPRAPNSVEHLAALIDTIPYTLVCGVSKRVERIYKR